VRFRTRLAGLARWLFVEPRVVWATVLAPFVAVFVTRFLRHAPEARIRTAGFAMTLFGVVLVVKAIRDTQILFQRPTMRIRALTWLRKLPRLLGRTQVIEAVGIASGAATFSGRLDARVVPKDPASLESRVYALEENLRRVDDRVTAEERRIDAELRRVSELVSNERDARERAVAALDRRLADYSAGDLDWEIAGTIWLVIGQAMGSFPAEIASVMPRWM
jgi:hypothetical protein